MMFGASGSFVLTGHCPTLATFTPTSSLSLSLSSSSLRTKDDDEDVMGEAIVTAAAPNITASIENEGRILVKKKKQGFVVTIVGFRRRLIFWFDSD